MLEKEEVELPLGTTASGTEGSQGHFNNVWIKSELTMLMNLPGCTLKPLALAVRRHPRALLCALAMGMSGAQAADAVDADTSGSAVSTSAAVVPATTQLQRVEVTGSAIRRVDAETAVPITILRADDLKKQGVTTTQEMVQRITGSQSIQNSAGSIGASTGGASFADMRGIGANKTLVLLNGRRLANNAISGVGTPNGSAIDLNMIPFAAIDRVEVLRGASGLLVGAGQPGGAVNLVRKRPTAENKFSITTRAGSWDQYRVDLDGSGKLNDSGTLRGRMVAAYDDSGSYLDGRDSRTPLLYGIVEADLSDDTTLTMSLRRQEQVINGYSIYGLPRYSNGQSLGLSRSTNLAQKWNRHESDMTEVFTEVAHRFNEDWTSRTSLTYSQGGFDQNIAFARGAVNPVTLAGSNFQGTLFRKDEVDSVGLNSQLEGNFNAFGLEHQVTLGVDWSKQNANTHQATVTRRTAINVFDVDQNAFAKPARPAWQTDIDTTEERAGLYANTRIHLSEPLSVVLGTRLSWYDYKYDVKTGLAKDYESKQTQEFTPFAGVIYDINDSWSWYASYADIFTPQANYVTSAGSPLDPAIGSNYETGFKGELFDKRMNLSMALFYIKQKDVAAVDLAAQDTLTTCPTSSDGSCYLQDGISRSKGVDVEASGEVLPGLQVFGGYTYNMLRNNGDSDVAYETPKHMLRLNTSYNLPGAWNRLTVGAGVSADSGYEVPSNKELGVAGRAIWDARASWKLDENWKVSLNAENLFDRKYYTTSIATDRSNVYGEPRSYVLTLRGDF
ncbi:TonB-dependent siderophore receptor [Pseudomonas syringae pv. solidagae]|uniref:TonB-dependent siderophore receptor n=1 Tax=Pseudomonas syringae TaxID=317 RepID=UPI0006E68F86|nr:TonB-dependent siderophore receptor [Pseudomonas syringae]KPY63331.1 TonB-dependent siderophore receptor [Pseudomonas syringae pv. solidagae]